MSLATIHTARIMYPGDAPPIEGGALLDLNGRIAAVGTLAEVKRQHPAITIIDHGDALLLPLLVNAHTHLELTDCHQWATKFGEIVNPAEFVDWILQLIRIKRNLSRVDYCNSLANGISASVAAGTGAVGDIISQYFARTAYQGAPLLGTLFLESLGQDPTVVGKLKNNINAVLADKRAGLLQLGLSPHAPYSISASYLRDIYQKCQQERLGCMTHLAESPAEVEFIEKGRGPLATKLYPKIGWEYLVPPAQNCRPVEYLRRNGGLSAGNILVHGVQLESAEIELLAASNCSLVLCPRSNDRLKVGKAPVAELQKSGLRLALGTDSMASNDSLSVWDEIAFAHKWFKGQLDAPALFRMATLGGAQVLGLQQDLGSLTAGKLSSFQVLKPKTKLAVTELLDYSVAPGRTADIAQVYMRSRAQLSKRKGQGYD